MRCTHIISLQQLRLYNTYRSTLAHLPPPPSPAPDDADADATCQLRLFAIRAINKVLSACLSEESKSKLSSSSSSSSSSSRRLSVMGVTVALSGDGVDG